MICIYHKNCSDGFGAALAVKTYADRNAIEVEFFPAMYGDTPPDVEGRHVVIVDFSYPRAVLESMALVSKSIIVLDHHKSAEENLEGLDYCIFDSSKSGAVLAWEHFLPTIPVPMLLQHIEDRDLWKFELADTKAISSGLRLLEMDFDEWSYYLDSNKLPELIATGTTILKYQDKLVKGAINKGFEMVLIGGVEVPCVNSTILASEIGHELSKDQPFAAVYFETLSERVYSLRSAEGRMDVSKIAKLYGGGGHKHAAGFTIKKPDITSYLDTEIE